MELGHISDTLYGNFGLVIDTSGLEVERKSNVLLPCYIIDGVNHKEVDMVHLLQ